MAANVLSVLSLVISVAALTVAIRGRRRQLLAELHASFITAEASERRRKLHKLADGEEEKWFETAAEKDRASANSALAQMDALAFQAVRGYVDLDPALMLWGTAAERCWKSGKAWCEYRRDNEGSHLWLWLEKFVSLARSRPNITRYSKATRARWWDRWL